MTLHLSFFHPSGSDKNYNNLSASIWIRCLQLIPYLETYGVKCSVNDLKTKPDIAVFVRWQDETAFTLAQDLKSQGILVVLDLCVNYFDVTRVKYIKQPVTSHHREQVIRMISVADLVICASDFIAKRARKFHPWVEYLPDSIDPNHFKFDKPVEDFYRPRIRAIWSGISSKAKELSPVLPILKKLGLDLTLISNVPPHLNLSRWPWAHKYPYKFIRWSYDTFPIEIISGEICIAPRLINNPYNLGHSVFKIGVFMAEGIPVIASALPSYLEVLKGGHAGIICNKTDEWEDEISAIIKNREILVKWSQEAKLAIEPFSTRNIVSQYVRIFHQLISG